MTKLRRPIKKKKEEKVEHKRTKFSDTMEEMEDDLYIPIDTSLVVSTGSTLLDLAISGGRIRGGGIPGGIMVEISGPPKSGKTAVAVEIATSIQFKGGEADIADPEGRLDKQYTGVYGLNFDDIEYTRPDTVNEVFEELRNWEPKNENVINGKIIDSIAALSTEKEMEEEDKRGQLKAKQMHMGCRRTARLIANKYKLVVFTNHEMDATYGKTNPGGKAVPYYSSLRIRIAKKDKIAPEKKIHTGVKVKKTIGILAEATIKASSVDDEYRTAPLYIIFGRGIDDVRANLQWYKQMTKSTKYLAVDKEYQVLNAAIKYIEDNDLEGELRDMVIDLWEDIEDAFKVKRKKKVRF